MEKDLDRSVSIEWNRLFDQLVGEAVRYVVDKFTFEPTSEVEKALVTVVSPAMRSNVLEHTSLKVVDGLSRREDLKEKVKVEWNKVLSALIRNAVMDINELFSGVDPVELDNALLRAVKPSVAIQVARSMPKRTASYAMGSQMIGCVNVDSEGYVVDPVTQDSVREGRLISLVSGGVKYCFDVDTLYEYIMKSRQSGRPVNPISREPFTDDFIKEVVSRSTAPLSSILGNTTLSYPSYTKNGELVLTVHRETGSILDFIVANDILADGVSLYSVPLLELVRRNIGELQLSPFVSAAERESKLLLMFRFAKKTSDAISTTLTSFLGALLGLVPVYSDRDIGIPITSTVIDVIITALRSYGYQYWDSMDLRLENGTSLYALRLDRYVTEVIPGEKVYTVYEEFGGNKLGLVTSKLLYYANRAGDVELTETILSRTLAKANALISRLPTGENVEEELYGDDVLFYLSTLHIPQDVREGMLERILKALVSGKVHPVTRKKLWLLLEEEVGTKRIRSGILALPLKEVSIDVDWEEYMYYRKGGHKTYEPNTVDYAKKYITGEGYDVPIDLSAVAELDSTELVDLLLSEGKITTEDVSTIVLINFDLVTVPRWDSTPIRRKYGTPPTIRSDTYPSLLSVVVGSGDTIGDLILKVLDNIEYKDLEEIEIVSHNPEGESGRDRYIHNHYPGLSSSVMEIANHTVVVSKDERSRDWHDALVRLAYSHNSTPLLSALGLISLQSILDKPLTLTRRDYREVFSVAEYDPSSFFEFIRELTKMILCVEGVYEAVDVRGIWNNNHWVQDVMSEVVIMVPLKDVVLKEWEWYLAARNGLSSVGLVPYFHESAKLLDWFVHGTPISTDRYLPFIHETMSEELTQALLDYGLIDQETYSNSIQDIREKSVALLERLERSRDEG